jgi:glycosyltransferase involved in cell wall biosynthesis
MQNYSDKKILIFQSMTTSSIYLDLKKKKFTKPSILFVGRLIKKKGIQLLIDASKKFSNINFHIIGAGPMSGKLNTKQKNLFYHGFVKSSDDKIRELYNRCHFLSLISLYNEAYGLVFQESVICGTPILVSNKIGASKIIRKYHLGVAINPTLISLNKFLHQIKKYILKYSSDRQRLRISNYAKNTFDKVNIEDYF